MNTSSIADLARCLHVPADSLYHHIEILEQAGLVERAGTRSKGRHSEALYRRTSDYLDLPYNAATGENHEFMIRFTQVLLKATQKLLADSLKAGNMSESAPRSLTYGFNPAWLELTDLIEVNVHIDAIEKILSRNRKPNRGKLYCFGIFGFPIVRGRKSRVAGKAAVYQEAHSEN